MNELSNQGYINIYGIDSSEKLVSSNLLSNSIVVGNVLDRSNFEQNTFTHITSLGNQIYETDKKATFLKNCYYWLKPGGYLILRLVENIRPNTTKPIREQNIKGVDYKVTVEPGTNKSSVLLSEHMTNMNTGQQRINETTLYVREIGDIINDALYSGFIVTGKTTSKPSSYSSLSADSSREYLYFFQK
jgi:hypothetical protein